MRYIITCDVCGNSYLSDSETANCGYCKLKSLEALIKVKDVALKFYADESNYSYVDDMPYGSETTYVDCDHGVKAFEALNTWYDGTCKKCKSPTIETSARNDECEEAIKKFADYKNMCTNEKCEEHKWHYFSDQDEPDYYIHKTW